MPWNGTTLWLAQLAPEGAPGEPVPWPAAGASRSSSRSGRPDGVLHFASDRSGWWNLYRCCPESGEAEPVAAVAGDVGVPQWVFRLRRYAFLGDGSIAAVYTGPAGTNLLVHEPRRDHPRPARPGHLAVLARWPPARDLFLVAGSPTAPGGGPGGRGHRRH